MNTKTFKVLVLFFLLLTLVLFIFPSKKHVSAQTCTGSAQYVDYSCVFDDITLLYSCIANGGMTVACAGVPCQTFGPVFCWGGLSCGLSAYGSTAGCSTTPVPPAVCGNGTRETGEGCDDGNKTNGDGCSSSCQIETSKPVCGNGKKETGEGCDDGNKTNGDGCSSSCQLEPSLPVCPNGIVEAGEACDDGNSNNLDGCRNNCTTPYCGDGIIDSPGETCDGGVGCTSNCTGITGGGYACNGSSCEASVGGPYTASDCGGACNTPTGQFFCGNDLACHPCGAGDSNCKSLGDCQSECVCTSPGGCFVSGCNPLATSGICDGALIPGANTTGCMGNGWMDLLDLASKRVRYNLDCGNANWGQTNIGGGGTNYEGLGVLRKLPNPPDPNYPWVEVALVPNGQGGSIDFTDPYLTTGVNQYKVIARCAYRENTGTADRIKWVKIGGTTYHNNDDFYDVSMYSACSQDKILQLVLTPPVCNNWFVSPNIDSIPKTVSIESNAYDGEGLSGGGMYYSTTQNGAYGSIDSNGNFVAGTAGEIIANRADYFSSGTLAGKITSTFNIQNLPSGNYQFQGNYWNKYASFPSTDPLHFKQCLSPQVYIDNTPPTCGNWNFNPASPLDSTQNSFSVSTSATDNSAIRDFGFYYQNYDESTSTWGYYDAGGVFVPNSYVPLVKNKSDYFTPPVPSPTTTNFINRSNIPSNKFRFFANYWDSSAPHNLSAGSNNFSQCVSPVYEIKSSAPVISLTIPAATTYKGYNNYYSDGKYSVQVKITDTPGDVNTYNWGVLGGLLTGSLTSGLKNGTVVNYPFSLSLDWAPGSAFNQVGTSQVSFNSIDSQGNDITVSDQISTVSPTFTANTSLRYRNKVVSGSQDLKAFCEDAEFNNNANTKNFNSGNNGISAIVNFTSAGPLASSSYNKSFNTKIQGADVYTNLVEMVGTSYYTASFLPQFTVPGYEVLCIKDMTNNKTYSGQSDLLVNVARESTLNLRAVFGKVTPKGWFQAVGGNIFTGAAPTYQYPDVSEVTSAFTANLYNLSSSTTASFNTPPAEAIFSNLKAGIVVSNLLNGTITRTGGSPDSVSSSGGSVASCSSTGDCKAGLASYFDGLLNNLSWNTLLWSEAALGGITNTSGSTYTLALMDHDLGLTNLSKFTNGSGSVFLLSGGDLTVSGNVTKASNESTSIIILVNGDLTITKDVRRLDTTFLVKGSVTVQGETNGANFEKDAPLLVNGGIYAVQGITLNRTTAQKALNENPYYGHYENSRPVDTFIFQPEIFLGISPTKAQTVNLYLNRND